MSTSNSTLRQTHNTFTKVIVTRNARLNRQGTCSAIAAKTERSYKTTSSTDLWQNVLRKPFEHHYQVAIRRQGTPKESYEQRLQVTADPKSALREAEVLEAGKHHGKGKLAQAGGWGLQQEQGCLLSQQPCPHTV